MATYYMRADGSAANKGAATSPGDSTTSMSMSVHNSETFAAGDTIVMSPVGGVFRGTSGAVMTPPSDGTGGSKILYTTDENLSTRAIVSGAADLTDTATYRWTESPATAGEFYCELLAGGNPSLSTPGNLWIDRIRSTEGTVGSLTDQQWDYGNNDTQRRKAQYTRDQHGLHQA